MNIAAPAIPRVTEPPRTTHAKEVRARRYQIARLAVRRASAYAKLRTCQVGRNHARRAELADSYLIRTAEEVSATFGNMRGAMAKIGQLLAGTAIGLPDSARQALASLYSGAPSMPRGVAERVIERELEHEPHELFAHWDPVPAAAASIGQVHRAVLADGRAVAVKVQYPGLDETLGADLANASALGALFTRFTFPGLDVSSLVESLRGALANELDFRIEAASQAHFAQRWARDSAINVPNVVPELSTRRVLVTEWVDGTDLETFAATASQGERDAAGTALLRFALESIFRGDSYQADLHPGNVRFDAGGTVTVLDYGLVQSWTADDHRRFAPLIYSILEGNDADVRRAAVAAGVIAADATVSDADLAAYLRTPYELFRSGERRFTLDWYEEAVRKTFNFSGPNANVLSELAIPTPYVFLDRVLWGVMSMLSALNAAADWSAMLRPYVTARGVLPTEYRAGSHR